MTLRFRFLAGSLSIAAIAWTLAGPSYALADEPASAAATEARTDEKPRETPEEPPKSKGQALYEQAFAELRRLDLTPETIPAALRAARDLFRRIGELPDSDADADLKARAEIMRGRMAMLLLTHGTPEEKEALLGQIADELVAPDTYAPMDLMAMGTVIETAARIDPKRGEQVLARFRAAVEEKADDELKETGLSRLDGVYRRATLVGNKLELSGTTVEGKRFDLIDLNGKVVLVDFWATWCGPCLVEQPNLRRNYLKYRDKGFEIVGVSIDEDREALDAFLADSRTDWTVLHDAEGKNPATERYGVMSIPTMFLVDEKGKVVTTEAYGEELTRLLEERFGKVELSPEVEKELLEDEAPGDFGGEEN